MRRAPDTDAAPTCTQQSPADTFAPEMLVDVDDLCNRFQGSLATPLVANLTDDNPALNDLDGDGVAEIVAQTADDHVVAYDAKGGS